MKAIDKLTDALKKYGRYQQGEVYTNKNGVKYRYDRYTYKVTPYWLKNLFDKARAELKKEGLKVELNRFNYNKISYAFSRAEFIGQSDREMGIQELVILG